MVAAEMKCRVCNGRKANIGDKCFDCHCKLGNIDSRACNTFAIRKEMMLQDMPLRVNKSIPVLSGYRLIQRSEGLSKERRGLLSRKV